MTTAKKNIFIKYTVASVMLFVIGLQFILVRTVHVSPWKAGGFGMFSTINTPVSHIIRLFADTGNGKKLPLIIPDKFEPYERSIRHIATVSAVNGLKNALKNEKWVVRNSSLVVAAGDSTNYPRVKLNRIRLELWSYHFDHDSKKFYSTQLAEF